MSIIQPKSVSSKIVQKVIATGKMQTMIEEELWSVE